MKIALTGNIASGKSIVQKILEEQGFKVLDTDACGHNALKLPTVKQALSHLDIFVNGEISRDKLGALFFSKPEIKVELENLVHPIIKQNIIDFLQENQDAKHIFVAVPLVFEANMTDLFDKITFIYADDNIRLKRLIARNNYDKAYALQRINSQLPQKEKMMHSDYVISNNGSLAELNSEVLNFLSKLS